MKTAENQEKKNYHIGYCHQCFSKFQCGVEKYEDMKLYGSTLERIQSELNLTNKKCDDFWLCKDSGPLLAI